MPLATGTRLGPYEIDAPLGAGGMGEVYSARDTRLARTVAIKVLPSHRSDQPEARERFDREARAIAALNHPNICQIYDVGSQGPIDYLVLEYLQGVSLADRLATGAIPFNQILRFALEVADALDAAHRRGIIHRDLKPGNIFLTAHGECKVLDFGLAKLVHADVPEAATATSPVTMAGTAVGTIAYMSPEQARGETLDERTDIFSFGAVLYEMATGKPAFQGKTSAVIFKAILDETPVALSERNPILPERLDDVVSKALEKDRNLRYQSAAELRADLQRLKRDSESGTAVQVSRQKKSTRTPWVAIPAFLLLAAAAAGIFYFVEHRSLPRSTAWEQLTFFTDSAVYPALSPDGRMLAFIRGNSTFFGRGEIYVKMLPSGDAVQLTHDAGLKLAPAFSFDGSRISYSIVDPWDVWQIPVLGGQPSLVMRNASSLSWIDSGKRLLFSELRNGLHLVLVTTNEGRGESRDVYVPPGQRSMVHHSYLSPDGRWVLMVVMDARGSLLPCEVAPFDGTGNTRVVGPAEGTCTSGAWSADGKWLYVSSSSGGRFHIWRQRFPDGPLQQVTSGTTEEEGIALSPDGESLLTSVGTEDDTIWLHDGQGDHQLSSEGSASAATISWDKSKIYYLLVQNDKGTGSSLWVHNLADGTSERIASGPTIQNGARLQEYALSHDGKTVAFSTRNDSGKTQIWLASVDRRSSPRQLASSTSQDSPSFLPDGDLLIRSLEGSQNFLYRIRPDGTERRKITADPIFDIFSTSPDGRWVVASATGPDDDHPYATVAYPVNGGDPLRLCNAFCAGNWDVSGKYFYLIFDALQGINSYSMPVNPARGIPDLPAGGIRGDADFKAALKADKRVAVIPRGIDSAAGPNFYTYTLRNTRRNIYRIPLPD